MEAEILFPLTTMKVRASVIELDMSAKRNKTKRRGLALLVVLIIVMTITVLSLGFLSRSDVELACGENMILKTQMDYLAESALEHAKGLILNPQDVASEYWAGAASQQLVVGSDDYYNVVVVRDDPNYCNYFINGEAYRLKGAEQVGRSSLTAELRLDPVIAYWCEGSTVISDQMVINGDMYCNGIISGAGPIYGDAYAWDVITATNVQGKRYEGVSSPPVTEPGLNYRDYKSSYYIGSQSYAVQQIPTGIYSGPPLVPSPTNPAGVYYCRGNLTLSGNVNITGMLVVKGSLMIEEYADVSITAVKNFPALLTNMNLTFIDSGDPNDAGARLSIIGLAQVGSYIDMVNLVGSHMEVFGTLVSQSSGIITTAGCTVNITAAPDKAAIQTWPAADTPVRWTPAAGAFFKGIERQ